MAPFSDSVRDQYNRPVLGATVGIYTPSGVAVALYTASGAKIDNPMLVDALANYEFYADDGKYRREIRLGSLLLEASDIIVGSPPEFKGDPGASDNTYSSYAAMQASDPTKLAARLVGDTDSPPHPDGPYSNPTQSIGGWVAQPATGIAYDARQSVSDKLDRVVMVTDARFAGGARGDGSTDDTAAIQAALDIVSALGGGSVTVPNGTYRVRDLLLKSKVKLLGSGGSVFKLYQPSVSGYIARVQGQRDILVADIEFDCTTEAGLTGSLGGVQVTRDGGTASQNINFENCVFRNAQNVGWLELRGGTLNSRAERCHFLDHHYEAAGGTHGLTIAEDANGIHVVGCVLDHPSGSVTASPSRGHIGIDRATNVFIDRCIIRRAPLNGITIEDNAETLTQNIAITNSTISECANSGLQSEGNGLISLTIDNVVLQDNGEYGIKLAGDNYLRVALSGLTFRGNASVGNLALGKSQLSINAGAGQVVQAVNLKFETASSHAQFTHLFYLDGDLTVDSATFNGGAYGIYSPDDDENAQERDTPILTNLRFLNVAMPTSGVPQFFGDSWIINAERRMLTGFVTKALAPNMDVDLFDIRTGKFGGHGAGSFGVDLRTQVSQAVDDATIALSGFAAHSFACGRKADGAGTFSTVSLVKDDFATGSAADRNITDIAVVPTDVNDGNYRRCNVSVRVNMTGSSIPASVIVTQHIEILWGGFRTAPVIV